MNTDGAIGFSYINFLKAIKEFVTKGFYNPPGLKDINKRIDQVIELLKRGEKYEAMFKELKKRYWNKPNGVEITLDVCNAIERIEQKYFPKDKEKVIK